jgi:hypothetical protein
MQIDQLLHGEEYLPNQLIGIASDSLSKLSPQELSNCVNRFWMQKDGEDKQAFSALVSELINKSEGRLYVLKRHGDAIAFYGITEKEDSTDIELLRIFEKDICNALFFQIISEVLKRNLKSEKTRIVFREKYVTEKQKDILDKFGFVLQNDIYIKFVYNIIVAKEEVSNIIHQSYPSITVENNDRLLLAVERKLFPLKIKGLNIPTYIVPIMPYWAGQLFDLAIAGEDLFGANPEKLWSFENVYYRHTKPITEKYPARILWYVSGKDVRYSHAKSIVASSYLTEVMTGKPKDLFHVNRRYGIYEWKDIYKLCGSDINTDIRALKFCHTEVFEYPISFAKIQEIFIANGRKRNTFASPVEINDTIYFQLYQLGRWKEQK